jgi:hypothetical protein
MFDIDIRADVKKLEKQLNNLAYKQLPFGTAIALTELAKLTAAAEKKNISQVLDNPTPFTVGSVGVKAARKDTQQATVYLKDIAAAYLEPYEFGGINKLNSRALLRPANLRVNQYGNLSRTKLAQLKARQDIFIGKVKTKSGEIDGVWQRIKAMRGKPASLKLLIKFEDAHEVTQHLGWRDLAKKVVAANLNREMGKGLAKAIATRRN